MKPETDIENLQRARQPMPDFVAESLQENRLRHAYDTRPAYQRNDYLSWINRAVRDATKEKRLKQMLDELAANNCYMGMKWNHKGG